MPHLIHFSGGLVVVLLLVLVSWDSESELARRKESSSPPWSYCWVGVKLKERRAERKVDRSPRVRVEVEGGRAVGAGRGG